MVKSVTRQEPVSDVLSLCCFHIDLSASWFYVGKKQTSSGGLFRNFIVESSQSVKYLTSSDLYLTTVRESYLLQHKLQGYDTLVTHASPD